MSIVCFSTGLCLFTYASEQVYITRIVTTLLTVFTFFGLATVSAWLAMERYIFVRHRGRKWLSDVLTELTERFPAVPGADKASKIFPGIKHMFCVAKQTLLRATSKTVSLPSAHNGDFEEYDDLETNILPLATVRSYDTSITAGVYQLPVVSDLDPDTNLLAPPSTESRPTLLSASETTTPTTPGPGPTRGQILWRNAFQTLRTMRSSTAERAPTVRAPPVRAMQTAAEEAVTHSRVATRVATLRGKLNILIPTEELEAHQALVRHLQFSPNGKFLATSSWDRTSIIWRVEKSSLSLHRVLAHPGGFVSRVAWSDTGNLLLTKLLRGVKVWTEDGVCKKTINRGTNIESITWFPGGAAFLSVEGNTVTKLDLHGNILDQYEFGQIKLHDVAVTPDGMRLLGVGSLLASPTGLQPSKSPAEKCLIVYNMELKQIEHQTPVFDDVRDITLAQNTRRGLIALVSYANNAPPQLWKIEFVPDGENPALVVGRLTLRHTYMPKDVVDFAGPSCFGGRKDELVLCAEKTGDIHIWDQESGTLLRRIRAPTQQSGDLTCFAWDSAAEDPFIFTTGSSGGAIRLWTEPELDVQPVRHLDEGDAGGDSPEDSVQTQAATAETRADVHQRGVP